MILGPVKCNDGAWCGAAWLQSQQCLLIMGGPGFQGPVSKTKPNQVKSSSDSLHRTEKEKKSFNFLWRHHKILYSQSNHIAKLKEHCTARLLNELLSCTCQTSMNLPRNRQTNERVLKSKPCCIYTHLILTNPSDFDKGAKIVFFPPVFSIDGKLDALPQRNEIRSFL